MTAAITTEAVVCVSNNQVSGELPDGEVAILETNAGVYYGLDPIGARVWQLIQEPIQLKKLCEQLTQEYEVEYSTCLADVIALLEDMQSHQLVEIRQHA